MRAEWTIALLRLTALTTHDTHAAGGASGSGLLKYHGGNAGAGVTTGSPLVYLVFLGRISLSSTDANGYVNVSGDSAGVAPRLQAMFSGVGPMARRGRAS